MSEAPAKFEGLLQRVRSALILLPFVVAPVFFGGWLFALLLAVVGFLMAREWTNLLKAPAGDGVTLGVTVMLLLAFGLMLSPIDAIMLMVVACIACASYCFALGKRLSPLVGGLVYVALPLLAAQFLRLDPLGVFLIGYLLISVWAVDIFAMFSGKIIGGPKLAPTISPKKTWAGLIGGMVGAVLAAILSFFTLVGFGFGQMSFTAVIIIAPLLAICSQIFDLFESAIKRRYDVKDSGVLIPGHGGLLDRVDGLIGVLVIALLITAWRGGAASQALWIW